MSPNLLPLWLPRSITKAVLRAFGLELIALYLPPLGLHRGLIASGSHSGEEPKTVLCPGFLLALSRCAVHIFPMAMFAVLLWVNYQTLYIGPTFVKDKDMESVFLAIYQVFAKIQELFCVGSLSTIVLHALRQELLAEGVPLGLLGSSVWFNSLSSFWSPEFWFALRWGGQGLKRARFILLLVVCGGLAAVIGPASAVLMLPRKQNVPAGGSSFYLDGTSNDYWPDVVTANAEPDFCALQNATEYDVCPSGGYQSLSHTFNNINVTNACGWVGRRFSPECQAIGAQDDRQFNNLLIQSSGSLVPPMLNTFLSSGIAPAVSLTQPHAATIIQIKRLLSQWNVGADVSMDITLGKQFQWTYELETFGSNVSPWVRSRCSAAQNLSVNAESAEFPFLQWQDIGYLRPSPTGFDVLVLAKNASLSSLDRSPSEQIRTQWVALPDDEFGNPFSGQTVAGLLVEFPWRQDTVPSRLALACAVTASWHTGFVLARRSAAYDAFGISIDQFEDTAGNPEFNRPLQLDKSWLDTLTLSASNAGPQDKYMNILERLFTNVGVARFIEDLHSKPFWFFSGDECEWGILKENWTDVQAWNDLTCDKGDKIYFIQLTLAALVADGLSRYGSHRLFIHQPDIRDWRLQPLHTYNTSRVLAQLPQSKPRPTGSPSGWVEIYVNGWAYYPRSTSDYLALAIVCVYMLLAITHVGTIFLLPSHRVTSSAWDTITELLVLCQNSNPSPDGPLKNATAGIRRRQTYRTIVQVRAYEPQQGDGDDAFREYGRQYGGRVSLQVANNAVNAEGKHENHATSTPDSKTHTVSALQLTPQTSSGAPSSSDRSPKPTVKVQKEFQKVQVGLKYG